MQKKYVLFAAAAILGVVFLHQAWAQGNAAAPAKDAKKEASIAADAVVAKVNGHVIRGSDLTDARSALRGPSAQMPLDAVYGPLQDRLIDGHLVLDAAKKAKLQDDKEFKEALRKSEEELLRNYYLKKEVAQKINDGVLRARYQELVKDFKPQPELKARHILVATEAEAKDIYAKLKGGADFAKLAAEKSTDKASGASGGDLGFFTADQVVEPFSKAAFALKDGEIAQPVESQFGWHVIQALSRRNSSASAFDQVKGEVQQMVTDEMLQAAFAKLRQGAKIEKFAMDGKPVTDAAPAAAAQPAAKATQ